MPAKITACINIHGRHRCGCECKTVHNYSTSDAYIYIYISFLPRSKSTRISIHSLCTQVMLMDEMFSNFNSFSTVKVVK